MGVDAIYRIPTSRTVSFDCQSSYMYPDTAMAPGEGKQGQLTCEIKTVVSTEPASDKKEIKRKRQAIKKARVMTAGAEPRPEQEQQEEKTRREGKGKKDSSAPVGLDF